MNSILRFIGRLIKLILFFIPFYVLTIIIWGVLSPKSLNGNIHTDDSEYLQMKHTELRSMEKADILFVGASNIYRGIDPRIFDQYGYNVFNLGTNSQTPEQSLILLKLYADKLKPELIIYDVYPSNFEKDGVESMIDIISTMEISSEHIQYLLENPNIKVLNTLIFHGFFQLIDMERPQFYQERNEYLMRSKYVQGGFVEYSDSLNHYIREFSQQEWQLREDQLKALDEALELLIEKNIPVLLIRTPLASYKYHSYENNDFVDSIFASKKDFYNFQMSLDLSDSLDFLDGTHMSQSGVEKFNKFLIDKLRELEY